MSEVCGAECAQQLVPYRLRVVVVDKRAALLKASLKNLVAKVVDVERIAITIVYDEIDCASRELKGVRDRIDDESATLGATINAVQLDVCPLIQISLMAIKNSLHPLAPNEKEREANFRERAQGLDELPPALPSVERCVQIIKFIYHN